MYYKELAEKFKYLKYDKQGVRCVQDEIREEGITIGQVKEIERNIKQD